MGGTMTPEEAVAALDAIAAGDGEGCHYEADRIIRSLLPDEVNEAYNRVIDRASFWAWA